jgi:polysaccharide export outer membrane protein
MINFRLRSPWHVTLFVLLTLGSVRALAQFNGPGSIGGQEMNRPTVLTSDPAVLYPAQPDFTLIPGDQIAIRIFGESDYTPAARIDIDGNVYLPLIGSVHLQGLSVPVAEQLIAQKLVTAGMYRDPQVILTLTEGPNASVTLVGEVHQVVPLLGSRRLLDVLATAGGIPTTASHVITIDRPGVADPIVVDVGNDPLHIRQADIPVFAGDTIIVSRIGVVYILGAFGTTGTVALNSYSPLTLTELTALSGGLKFEGKYSDLRIIRTVGNRRTVSVVNIKKVLNGKLPDPILQPNDIVYLAPSFIKTAISSPALGTALGLVSLLITLIEIR